MNKRYLKSGIVIAGAIILSTAFIQAGDVLRGVGTNLSGLAIESTGPCSAHAVLMSLGSHAVCVDVYEASAGTSCPSPDPQNELQTLENMEASSCLPASKPNQKPWRFVSLTEAQQLCARVGKRLPTNEEWYKAVSGIALENTTCAIATNESQPRETGTSACVTPLGVHDMIGNVWEWVDEEVANGSYHERLLPEEGYVTSVDTDGVVLETAEQPSRAYGDDYVWTSAEGVRGIIRGGFYNSGDDAGLYALNAAIPLDFRTTGIGFRCIEDVL